MNTNDPMHTGTGHSAIDDMTESRADVGNPGDEIGEAVGGISGVLTGAALGSLGGPVGTIIGGIAGAVSGWWAGRAISDAASHATDEDDAYYRTHFDTARGGMGSAGAVGMAPEAGMASGMAMDTSAAAGSTMGTTAGTATGAASGMGGAVRSYDDVRPAYQIGHLAGRNPDYQGRSFDEIEPDLQRGWTPDVSSRYGAWHEVRDYARSAYDRSRTMGQSAMGQSAVRDSSV